MRVLEKGFNALESHLTLLETFVPATQICLKGHWVCCVKCLKSVDSARPPTSRVLTLPQASMPTRRRLLSSLD